MYSHTSGTVSVQVHVHDSSSRLQSGSTCSSVLLSVTDMVDLGISLRSSGISAVSMYIVQHAWPPARVYNVHVHVHVGVRVHVHVYTCTIQLSDKCNVQCTLYITNVHARMHKQFASGHLFMAWL